MPNLFSLYISPSFQTLSNPSDKSRQTALTSDDEFVSKALSISFVIANSWRTQESLERNPDWLMFNRMLSCLMGCLIGC